MRQRSNYSVKYIWKVYQGVNYIPDIRSVSLDPRFFKLAPYSFKSSTVYTIVVTVSVETNRYTYTDNVLLTISQSGVVANIDGGNQRTVSVSQEVFLDASNSQDIDYPDSILLYKWSCLVISPNFGGQCGGFNNTYRPILHIQSFSFNASIVNITLYVFNAAGYSSSAICQLTYIKQDVPLVQIKGLQSKFNADSVIILTGVVSSLNGTAVAKWSSSSGLNLSSVVSTSLQKSVSGTNTVFQVAIVPNTLDPGLHYTFQLCAFYLSDPLSIATSSVVVTINVPPLNGILEISPSQGYSLTTPYYLLTSHWTDDLSDLPLKYMFSYISTSLATPIVLKTLDAMAYVTSYLGTGLSSSQSTVVCIATAFDIYNAAGNSSANTVVYPALSAEVVLSNSQTLLNKAVIVGDPSSAISLISTTMNSLNDMDCQVPYDCRTMNRAPCSTTPRTCGSCLNGFIGITGDANSPCVFKNATSVLSGDFCHSNLTCFSGLCSSNYCRDTPKSCINNCGKNNQNVCVYHDNYGSVLSSCSSTDVHCSADCKCGNNTYGVDCSLSLQQYTQSTSFKSLACKTILTSVGKQDVSADVVMSRITAV